MPNDFYALIKGFQRHFHDSDLASTPYRIIEAIRQTDACASYVSRFRELVQDWGVNEGSRKLWAQSPRQKLLISTNLN